MKLHYTNRRLDLDGSKEFIAAIKRDARSWSKSSVKDQDPGECWYLTKSHEDIEKKDDGDVIFVDNYDDLLHELYVRHPKDENGLSPVQPNSGGYIYIDDTNRHVADDTSPDLLAEYAKKYPLVLCTLKLRNSEKCVDISERYSTQWIWRGEYLVNARSIEYNPKMAKEKVAKRKALIGRRIKNNKLGVKTLKSIYWRLGSVIFDFIQEDEHDWFHVGRKTRDRLIKRINHYVMVVKKLKLSFRDQTTWGSIVELKPFVPNLLKHKNEEYVKLGKFLRAELRRKKDYHANVPSCDKPS
tara:strand:- start:125029 stop:125922 length:894 start_codon:yes stop_codon:yes gene_type:complete